MDNLNQVIRFNHRVNLQNGRLLLRFHFMRLVIALCVISIILMITDYCTTKSPEIISETNKTVTVKKYKMRLDKFLMKSECVKDCDTITVDKEITYYDAYIKSQDAFERRNKNGDYYVHLNIVDRALNTHLYVNESIAKRLMREKKCRIKKIKSDYTETKYEIIWKK